MPYIVPQQRERIDEFLDAASIQSPGQMAYAITRLISSWLGKQDRVGYDQMAVIVGVLETVKLEYYRHEVSFYEDLKKEENGDVEW